MDPYGLTWLPHSLAPFSLVRTFAFAIPTALNALSVSTSLYWPISMHPPSL